MSALDELAEYLRWYHPSYTINDVAPTHTHGYLKCTKPCPGAKSGHWWCAQQEHYHTISLPAHKGYGRGPYAFWRAVCAELEAKNN